MTSAGVGVAVHLDGFTAAGLAAHRALAAAGTRTASVAIVFAGIKHDDDEYAGVLCAVRRTLPDAAIIGCSATGVLTGAEEVENANAVAVQVLGGEPPLPTPLFLPGVRTEPRVRGREAGTAGARRARRRRRRRGRRRAGRSRGARRRGLRRRHRRRRARAADHRRGRVGRRAGLPRVLGGVGARRLGGRAGAAQGAAPEPGDDPGLPGARRSADHHGRGGEPDPRDRRPPRGRGVRAHAVGSAPPGAAPDDAAPARRDRRARLGRSVELRRPAVRGRRRRSARRWRWPSPCAPGRRSASRCATRSARATT